MESFFILELSWKFCTASGAIDSFVDVFFLSIFGSFFGTLAAAEPNLEGATKRWR
jgi:hypothetical protein